MLSLKKYDPGIHCSLAYWMAIAGQREEDIAGEFGIPLGTLHTWRNRYPELRSAMKPGRDFIDNLVEGSLLKRALGFEYTEVTRERVLIEGSARTVVTKRVKKLIPGEVGAQAFWLKNRKGWRDKVDVVHGGTIATRYDLERLSDDKLSKLEEVLLEAEVPVAGQN